MRIRSTLLALTLGLAQAAGQAQAWPSRSISLVTPLAAGSASDVALRIVAEKLAAALGQAVVIENHTGASGAIGAEKVARAAPDGYTLCGCNNAILGVLPNVRKVPYDPAKSFVPVGTVAMLPTVLVVHPDLPVKHVAELLALLKAHPGKVSYATGGHGSAQHIAMALFEASTGARMLHVPYQGASAAAVGVAGGEVQVMFNAIGTVMPLLKAGKLRAIAVAGAQRTPILPGVPTAAEQGVMGYDYASWTAILAPAGVPPEVVNRLSTELINVLRSPDVIKRLADVGIDPLVMTPTQLQAYMAVDYQRMAKVVKDAAMMDRP